MADQATNCQALENGNLNKQHPILDERYRQQIQEILKENIIIIMDKFQEFAETIYSQDIGRQHWANSGIRRILASQAPPIQSVIDAGLVPTLIEFIKREDYPQLQLEACWSLANISSGTKKECQVVVKMNTIPLFLNLLQSKFTTIAEQAVWAISNISADSIKSRDLVIKEKGVQKIVRFMKVISVEKTINQCCWALSNICKGKPLPQYQLISEAIVVLCQAVLNGRIKDEQIFGDCLWAISFHSSDKQGKIDILESGVIPKVVSILNKGSSILLPSLIILNKISEKDEYGVNLLFSLEILSYLPALINHDKKAQYSEHLGCFVISLRAIRHKSMPLWKTKTLSWILYI